MRYFSLNVGINETIVTNQNNFRAEKNTWRYEISAVVSLYSVVDWDLVEELLFRSVEFIRVEAIPLKGSNTHFQFLPCFPIHLSHEPICCSLLRHDDL